MSFTFALRRCNVCGRMTMMPPRNKRCYDCQLMNYTKTRNPYNKKPQTPKEESPCN